MPASAPNSQQEMRRRNLSRVLHTVAEQAPVSRAGIAARVGLTRAAVSTLVDELLRGGLLTELGPGRTGGVGRPGHALDVGDHGPCGIGADVGVDRLAVVALDLRGRVRARAEVEGDHRDSDPDEVLARLAALVQETAAGAAGHGLAPAGLAVAVPGLVGRDSTRVVRTPNLGWPATDLRPRLPPTLPLTVDNEANFGALAELWHGGAEAPADFVHVSARIGIGGAVVLGGELLRGARGFAGELGHVPVVPEGRPCGCGGRGCLEQYAGEEALLGAAGLPAGHASPRSRTAVLAERAAQGDAAALRALRDAGRALGVALAGTVNLLDPEAVVLGGELAGLGRFLIPALTGELASRQAAPAPLPRLLTSAVGTDGPVLGAARSVVRAVLDDPMAYAPARA
ncbi:ROK family transcriptional regulator [Streptomyces sp. RKND-216]|uniref:ROK family transcriptional regulator n=1 Tax=Streptomyces sp. RKND-216 TaxID=2562581 RepID=UPI00109E08DC|nr:ROK family transcriptional regulator [Streptomyces sp. RKND-216]THA23550.1 ROK family transcriptional regulator [Streptomyces sp. RKND-216]